MPFKGNSNSYFNHDLGTAFSGDQVTISGCINHTGSTGVKYFVTAEVNASASNRFWLLAEAYAPGSKYRYWYGFEWSGTDIQYRVDGIEQNQSDVNTASGHEIHFCITYDASSVANTPQFFYHGTEPSQSLQTGPPTGSLDGAFDRFNYLADSSDANQLPSTLGNFAVWEEVKDDDTAKALSGSSPLSPLCTPSGLVVYVPAMRQAVSGNWSGELENWINPGETFTAGGTSLADESDPIIMSSGMLIPALPQDPGDPSSGGGWVAPGLRLANSGA